MCVKKPKQKQKEDIWTKVNLNGRKQYRTKIPNKQSHTANDDKKKTKKHIENKQKSEKKKIQIKMQKIVLTISNIEFGILYSFCPLLKFSYSFPKHYMLHHGYHICG